MEAAKQKFSSPILSPISGDTQCKFDVHKDMDLTEEE